MRNILTQSSPVLQGRPDAGQYRSGTLSLNKADGVGGFKDDPVFNLMSERVARLTRIPVDRDQPEAGRAHHETGTMYAESIGAQLARRTTVWPMQ